MNEINKKIDTYDIEKERFKYFFIFNIYRYVEAFVLKFDLRSS